MKNTVSSHVQQTQSQKACPLLSKHQGALVLVEAEPITIAKVPVNGNELHQSVLIHPRYVPKGIPHEIIKVKGCRRGRSLDILLDEPFEFNGVRYPILNFKGVGADADDSFVIRPGKWFAGEGGIRTQWYDVNDLSFGDKYGRIWGAARRREAKEEFENRAMTELGVPHTPYIMIHDIPEAVVSRILEIHQITDPELELSQMNRAFSTNIRLDTYPREEMKKYVDPIILAATDASMIKAQMALSKVGKQISWIGRFNDNRFLSGEITDAENISITNFNFEDSTRLLRDIMGESKKVCDGPSYEKYLSELERLTGLPFTLIIKTENIIGRSFLVHFALGGKNQYDDVIRSWMQHMSL